MSTVQQPKTRTRKPRRNFTEERARVISFCRLSIEVYAPLSADSSNSLAGYYQGRIEAYQSILKQYGEGE